MNIPRHRTRVILLISIRRYLEYVEAKLANFFAFFRINGITDAYTSSKYVIFDYDLKCRSSI